MTLIGCQFGFAGTSSPWDGTTWCITCPDIDQPHGNSYKEIFDVRKGIAIRMNYEHETLAASSAGGGHSQGAATTYFQDAIPLLDGDGTEFTTALDAGTLHIDTNHAFDNKLFFLLTADGAGANVWTGIYISLEAELVAATHSWADVQTFDVQSVHTLGILSNDDINLGAGDDLVGSATSQILLNTNKFTVDGATGNTLVGGTFDIQGTTAVVGVLDEDAMGSDSATNLSTQQSIKAYVDTSTSNKGFVKAWGRVSSAGVLQGSGFNVSTAKIATGRYTLTWGTNFADVNYSITGNTVGSAANHAFVVTSQSVGSAEVRTYTAAGIADISFDFMACGDQ